VRGHGQLEALAANSVHVAVECCEAHVARERAVGADARLLLLLLLVLAEVATV